jgi:protein SCO1
MKRNLIYAGMGALLGLVLIGIITLTSPYTYRGSLITPAVPAADFTLTSGSGASYQLSAQRGKLLLLFFGYTTCPDVCPATLGEMKQVRSRLGKQADSVEFVFVTVDPQRDTPERLGKYVAAFDPAFIGLTGSQAELDPVYQTFGVYHENVPSESGAIYLVNHSARIYLIDTSGNLRLTYAFGTAVDDILSDVRYVLKHKDE